MAGQQLVSTQQLKHLLEANIPLDHVVYAFAYGSGVLSQSTPPTTTSSSSNDNDTNKMIDFIVVVDDSYLFHEQNLATNPHHYHFLFGSRDRPQQARSIEWWQRHKVPGTLQKWLINPGLYFNIVQKAKIKYGIVQLQDLHQDLVDWSFLYLAGRMHKPVVPLVDKNGNSSSFSLVAQAQQQVNLPAALATSLLLLGHNNYDTASLDEMTLYRQIASLSFTGDPRMTVGAEDPAKISKLVSEPGPFRSLYRPAMEELSKKGILSLEEEELCSNNTNSKQQQQLGYKISWDYSSSAAQTVLWNQLPPRLGQTRSTSHLLAALPQIVGPAARYQSLKGLATVGFSTSWAYAMRKLSKGILKR